MITIKAVYLGPSVPSPNERDDVGVVMPLVLNEEYFVCSRSNESLRAFSINNLPGQNGKYQVSYEHEAGASTRIVATGQWLCVPARDVSLYIMIEAGNDFDQIRISDPEIWRSQFHPVPFYADQFADKT